MSYCPKIREDLLSGLFHLKHSMGKKKPITKLVNEAVEQYLDEKEKELRKENEVVANGSATISNSLNDPIEDGSRTNEFLSTLEFISGENGIIFHRIIKAETFNTAENKINKWLKNFHPGQFIKKDGNNYYYFGGEVAVKLGKIETLNIEEFLKLITID